jgi:signal transduction histidine kinase
MPHAIIVDDNDTNLYLLEALLKANGYTVCKAQNGSEALECALKSAPDLIISDILMPVMDGFSLCQAWKAHPTLRKIPFVFYTATYTDPQDEKFALNLGADLFIVKPTEPDAFLSEISSVLLCSQTGGLQPAREPQLEETGILRQYNSALIRKLEDKLGEQKRAEEALKDAARRKDEFLAMLGHELRNPLAPISTASHVLKLIGSADARVQHAAEIIERQVLHLGKIVDDLLDVSRVAHGKIAVHKEHIDLARIVHTTIEDFRGEIEKRGIRLDIKLPAGQLWIEGDATRLSQVVSNLLDNAKKFTEVGSIKIELRATADGKTGVLTVQDTGIGMTSQTLAGVFEAFRQANVGLARSQGGLGLGTALVKGLVELHGGTAEVASEGLKRGSRFTIRLPLSEILTAEIPNPKKGVAIGHKKVLVIDDNLDFADGLSTFLTLQGASVDIATDGPSGLKRVNEFKPDIVLCDIGLSSDMDGYAVARAIRHSPETHATYLVAITGYGKNEDKEHAQEAGFNLHMTKPVNLDELTRVLATAGAG